MITVQYSSLTSLIICRSDESYSILATFISFFTYKLYETIHSQRFVSTQRGYKIHTSWIQWQQQLLQTFSAPICQYRYLLQETTRRHAPQIGKLRRTSDWRSARRTLGTRLPLRFLVLRKFDYLLSCICCRWWLRRRKSLFTNPFWIARFVELLISFATLSVITLIDILFIWSLLYSKVRCVCLNSMVFNPRQKSTWVLNIQLEQLTLSYSTQLSTSRFNIQC